MQTVKNINIAVAEQIVLDQLYTLFFLGLGGDIDC